VASKNVPHRQSTSALSSAPGQGKGWGSENIVQQVKDEEKVVYTNSHLSLPRGKTFDFSIFFRCFLFDTIAFIFFAHLV
jgi:hypothetical protein